MSSKKYTRQEIFTFKVREYLSNGYCINPYTMCGDQGNGEMAKIDLIKTNDIDKDKRDLVRILFKKVVIHGQDIEEHVAVLLYKEVPKDAFFLWNEKGETLEYINY